ncbi:LysR family transcriptional regulator [Diaminobutyricibacter sp. McL0618]|uniref:LysR family transcriptional regulator n=1 Tax=Leifsonia sp. McL0618 TaxID=3415677 RepID=UPI003CF3D845
MNVTIEQLRVISAVAQSSSFSEAARSLRLTQPAVSRTVQIVEALVGAPLFSRTTRLVELTADGAEFVSVATGIIAEYDAGMGRFGAYQRAESGLLTVAALPVLASGLLGPAVAAFLKPRPAVQFRLVTGSAKEVMDRLSTGGADVAITELPTSSTGLSVTPLGPDPMCAVVAATHPLAKESSIRWEELAAHAFIQLSEGTSVRRLTDQGFAAAVAYPRSAITVDATTAALALMSEDVGITALPRSTQSLTGAREIRFIPLEGPAIHRELAAVSPVSPTPSALAATFIATLLSTRPNVATSRAVAPLADDRSLGRGSHLIDGDTGGQIHDTEAASITRNIEYP